MGGALSHEQVSIDLVRGKTRLECSPLGVIAEWNALGWIEECSTFGGPVIFENIGLDSMLTKLNV